MNCVQPGSFLTLHYRLRGPDGADVVNTFDDKPATLSLGTGQLAPAMESRLIGLAEGAHQTFQLAPGEAFGERNPDMLQRVARKLLRADGRRRTTTTRPATWCSSPRPTGRAPLPAWCARWATTGCCSTSTIRWPARR